MVLPSRPPISQTCQYLAKDEVESKQETLADLIDNFTDLPQEIWDQIYRYTLLGLDITTVPEPYVSSNQALLDAECEYNGYRAKQLYILDPPILTLIKCYESLFATSSDPGWKPLVWEHYVRFVFPSVLAMADVLVAYHAAGRLDQIRRVKVFSRYVVAFDYTDERDSLNIYVDTVLDAFRDLKLDRLEYEDESPLLIEYNKPPRIEVQGLVIDTLLAPGWRHLTILASQQFFSSQIVDQFIDHFRDIANTDPADQYIFDLPDTPTIKNGDDVTGLDAERYPPDAEQLYRALGTVWNRERKPSWLSGASVSPQIVIKRNQYGTPDPHKPVRNPPNELAMLYRDTINVMRGHIHWSTQTWNQRRRRGLIQHATSD